MKGLEDKIKITHKLEKKKGKENIFQIEVKYEKIRGAIQEI